MKRIIAALSAVVLAFSAALSAAAIPKPDATFVSGYYFGSDLHFYIHPKDSDELTEKFARFKNGATYSNNTTARKISNTKTTVHYLFLIDASDSMPWYSDRVYSVVDSLLEHEKLKYKVDVATMGADFDVLLADCKKKGKILDTVSSIEYTQPVSQICDGTLDAISYLRTKQTDGNTLLNIVLMTDGDTYMSETGRSEDVIAKIASETEKSVLKFSEVVVHSVCFEEWNETTYNAISSGSGVNSWAYDIYDAADAGEEIADYIDGLYRIDIPYSVKSTGARLSGSLMLSKDEGYDIRELKISSIRNYNAKDVEIVPDFDDDGNPVIRVEGQEQEQKPATATEKPAAPTEKPTKPSKGSDPSAPTSVGSNESSEPASTEPNAQTEKATESATPDEIVTEKDSSGDSFPIWIIFAIVGGVAVIGAVILILQKRSYAARKVEKPEQEARIKIIYEIICGPDNGMSGELGLNDELIIGSDPSCALVIHDELSARKNSKVFIENNMIYIDNYDDQSSTYLCGMKIFSKNRLRSGDEVSIGNTSILFKF